MICFDFLWENIIAFDIGQVNFTFGKCDNDPNLTITYGDNNNSLIK